jgi:hypothetical protein
LTGLDPSSKDSEEQKLEDSGPASSAPQAPRDAHTTSFLEVGDTMDLPKMASMWNFGFQSSFRKQRCREMKNHALRDKWNTSLQCFGDQAQLLKHTFFFQHQSEHSEH